MPEIYPVEKRVGLHSRFLGKLFIEGNTLPALPGGKFLEINRELRKSG
jgi:hypothetical protein